ncbi:hypothetical protein NC652_028295 [Populus alba x Populus x berolinensis]|nr:hypothetical protein NC652_028295 [Populus alba x Populus x berolinensis]
MHQIKVDSRNGFYISRLLIIIERRDRKRIRNKKRVYQVPPLTFSTPIWSARYPGTKPSFSQSTQHESIVWDRFGLDEDIPVRVVWLIIGYRYSG